MTKKVKVGKFALTGILLLMGMLIFTSCVPATPVTAPPVEPEESERIPPAVLVIPNVVTAGIKNKVEIAGVNFEPGEKVRIGILFFPGTETTPGAEGAGLAIEVNELGSFSLKDNIPPKFVPAGVYPVRIYDEEGKMIASTLVIVEAAEEQ